MNSRDGLENSSRAPSLTAKIKLLSLTGYNLGLLLASLRDITP
jgi:hypothetical protein